MVAKPSFEWKGAHAHIGPTHTANELRRRLASIGSYCGVIGLAAGVSSWGALAFASVRDVQPHLDLAQIAFFLMAPGHFKSTNWGAIGDVKQVTSGRKEDQALSELFHLLKGTLRPARWLDTDAAPVAELFHLTYLVRHILGASRKPFDRWLEVAIDSTTRRGNQKGFVARTYSASRARGWGHPFPPQLLEGDIKPAALGDAYARFVQQTDWNANRYYAPATSVWETLPKKMLAALENQGITSSKQLGGRSEFALSQTEGIDAGWFEVLKLDLVEQGIVLEA